MGSPVDIDVVRAAFRESNIPVAEIVIDRIERQLEGVSYENGYRHGLAAAEKILAELANESKRGATRAALVDGIRAIETRRLGDENRVAVNGHDVSSPSGGTDG